MKKFAIKLALFAAVNAAAAAAVLYAVDARYDFKQFETDSILLSMPRDTEVDLLIMGTSRARLLTRTKCNLECIERVLDCDVFNIAVPFGGGIVPEKIYLDQFYARGNNARTILYFLDVFTMYSPVPNKDHRFVYYEPLRPSLLLAMVRNDIPLKRLLVYVQSKFTWRWLNLTAGVVPCDYRTYEEGFKPELARLRTESMYFDGLNEQYFRHYAQTLRDILEMAKSHGSRIVIALPPTLLGTQPGAENLRQLLEDLNKEWPLEFYDFTDALKDTALYSDYDHLNSPGVERFVTRHLAPVLSRAAGQERKPDPIKAR